MYSLLRKDKDSLHMRPKVRYVKEKFGTQKLSKLKKNFYSSKDTLKVKKKKKPQSTD